MIDRIDGTAMAARTADVVRTSIRCTGPRRPNESAAVLEAEEVVPGRTAAKSIAQ
jgi:hypothetical protein